MDGNPDRVFLWACPRSMSSAFMRAIINRPKTKGFWEPFYRAYCFGSERVSKRFDGTPIQDGCSYLDIKKLCEADYPGYDMIFVKDQSHRFPGHMNMIPEGFKHTFILRNPRDSVSSFYKAVTTFGDPAWTYFEPAEVGFRELYDIFKYVTEELGQEAVIVETRDLQNHPEAMIRLYCDKVGIPFCKEMLNWSTRPEDLEVFPLYHLPWIKDLLSGTTFCPYKPKPPETFPEEVEAAITDNMPFYEKLYEHRLKLDA